MEKAARQALEVPVAHGFCPKSPHNFNRAVSLDVQPAL